MILELQRASEQLRAASGELLLSLPVNEAPPATRACESMLQTRDKTSVSHVSRPGFGGARCKCGNPSKSHLADGNAAYIGAGMEGGR